MTAEQETRLAEQIAALHDTVDELADTWDNSSDPNDPQTLAALERLARRAAVHLEEVRRALERA
jgi:hypothetical protein